MSTYRICSWNLANAVGDETSGVGRYGLRMSRQIDLLKTLHVDLLMLQEIRTCKDESGEGILEPKDIIYRFSKDLKLEIGGMERINTTDLTFWRATLYNPKTLWSGATIPVRSFNWSKSYTFDKDFGRMILYNQFAPYDAKTQTIEGHRCFWMGNLHFPLKLPDKYAYIDLLQKSMPSDPLIMAGDCNVFMDDHGAEQLAKMSELGLTEITTTNHITSTFVSFPWDKVQTKSHLDYAFIRPQNLMIKDVHVVDVSDTQISDHFPLIFDLTI